MLRALTAPGGERPPPMTRGQRRARGVVYTPPALVDFVVEQTLAPLAGARGALTVLDPACGDGRFLLAAARWAWRHAPKVALRLVGVERDPGSAERARQALADAPASVVLGEALLGAQVEPVDVVLGNPPYVRSVHLRSHDPELWRALRGRFAATSHGEWDLYAAFIERSLTWTRPGGRVGLVVPSRWLTAAFAAGLRARVASEVASVLDFGATQVFPGATTYASVLVLERARRRGEAVFVRHTDTGWQRDLLDLPASAGAPWIVRGGPARQALGGGGGTLGAVAQVAKGCGTNADRIFVVRGALRDGLLVGRNGLGHPVAIEAEAARPCLRGRDVRGDAEPPADHDAEQRDFCVLPYQLSASGRPTLWDWRELQRRLPALAAYLASQRAGLEARERGRFAGAEFYRFGRPQNLAFLLDPAPKLVVPDVTLGGRVCLDRGSLVLDSAYALRPHPDAPTPWRSLALLAALLRSSAVRLWLEMVGVPLRGNYVRMKTAFLAPMPLPPDGPELRAAAEAAEAGDRARADLHLRQAYAVPASAWTLAPRGP